jgi:hypothetical protein
VSVFVGSDEQGLQPNGIISKSAGLLVFICIEQSAICNRIDFTEGVYLPQTFSVTTDEVLVLVKRFVVVAGMRRHTLETIVNRGVDAFS